MSRIIRTSSGVKFPSKEDIFLDEQAKIAASKKLSMLAREKKEQAEFAEKYLRQGTKIAITGRIQTGSYTNREGQKVYTTDVVVEEQEFAESKNAGGSNGGYSADMTAVAMKETLTCSLRRLWIWSHVRQKQNCMRLLQKQLYCMQILNHAVLEMMLDANFVISF